MNVTQEVLDKCARLLGENRFVAVGRSPTNDSGPGIHDLHRGKNSRLSDGDLLLAILNRAAEMGTEVRQPCAANQTLERMREAAYEAGWRNCVAWTNGERDDLLTDIGSPAYLKDRDAALAQPAAAQTGNL